MSVLKGILHHWNKTTRNYDIIHPETESARVTDWHQGIVNTLASTALSGLVNTLTSDSLLATMIKKVLTATGVKYSIAQNGYLCFGSLFGGLIIQWVSHTIYTNNNDYSFTFPIAFNEVYSAAARCDAHNAILRTAVINSTTYEFSCAGSGGGSTCTAIFIGK